MSDTDSPLSEAPSDLEDQIQLKKSKSGILKFFTPSAKKPTKPSSPLPPKRSMTPPHEPVLADNDNIAFIVMFRSRFNEAFPKSLANFGPQELERGVVDSVPSEQVEDLLCALLGLLLNRKQDVKRGHYNRALEEAIQTHKSQWPKDWATKNPLLGNTTFMNMSPTQRLTLLRTLILWSLSSSETVKSIITVSYKQTRHEDDLNQPLSIQPWGSDGHKRRYFLIEGLDDTHFRVYRESNPANIKHRTWFSVAGDIDELKALAEKLGAEDGTKNAKILSNKMLVAVPRFEATEEKRKRREYRQQRKQQFKRPAEPTYSMYEGRTRGKRMKYTFSEDEDDIYSDQTTRRSTRNTRNHTPVEPAGPTITQSGRHVKTRQGGAYGESMLSGAHTPAITVGGTDGSLDEQDEDEDIVSRRPRRVAAATNQNGKRPRSGNHIHGYNSVDEMEDEEDASEQDYGDDEEEDVPVESDVDEPISDEDEEMEDADDDEAEKDHMIVKLQVKTPTPEKKIKLKLNLSSPAKPAVQENATQLPSPTFQATPKAHKSPLPNPTSYMDSGKPNGFAPQAINVGSGGA